MSACEDGQNRVSHGESVRVGSPAAYAGCPIQQEAHEVQKVKTVQHLTYAEAARKVKGAAETKRTNVQGTMAEPCSRRDVGPLRNKPEHRVSADP